MVTEVPGPKSKEMGERHERFVARGLALGFPAFIRKAEGAMLTDVDGNRFVDLAGGWQRHTSSSGGWCTRTTLSRRTGSTRK